jgi:hypothetical protein
VGTEIITSVVSLNMLNIWPVWQESRSICQAVEDEYKVCSIVQSMSNEEFDVPACKRTFTIGVEYERPVWSWVRMRRWDQDAMGASYMNS